MRSIRIGTSLIGGGLPSLTVTLDPEPLEGLYLATGMAWHLRGTVSSPTATVSIESEDGLTVYGTATVDGADWDFTGEAFDTAGPRSIVARASDAGSPDAESSPITITATTPFPGLIAVTNQHANMYRNKAGFGQGITDLHLAADGRWYETYVGWNSAFKAVVSVRRIDQDSWTTYTGDLEPHTQDADEHYNIVHVVDGARRMHLVGGVHDEPVRHVHLADGVFTPTAALAKFNRAWQSGDGVTPWETGATNEAGVTYPQFLKFTNVEGGSESAGDFLWMYRDGSSGEGNTILKYFDHNAGADGTMLALANPLIDGISSGDSAYLHRMALSAVAVTGGKRKVAVSWNWRATGVASTTHDVCVVFLLITPPVGANPPVVEAFKDPACTVPQTLPITAANAQYVRTIAQDHGLWDLGHVGFDETGLRPIITIALCHDPEDVHTGVDTPHDTQYRAFVYNTGTLAWDYYTLTALRDTTGHYDGGSGFVRGTAVSLQRDGKIVWYLNCAEPTSRYLGMTRIYTANLVDFDESQVVVGDGPGLGVCTSHLNWELLHRTGQRYAALPVQQVLTSPYPSQVNNNSYVYCEDIDTLQTPAPRLHQMGALSSGKHLWALQADSVTSSGGLISLAKNLVRGSLGEFNGVQAGADSTKPQLTSGPGSIPLITGDGVARYLPINGWNPNLPATENMFFWAIVRKNSHTAGDTLMGGSSNTLAVGYQSTDPGIAIRNTTLVGLTDMAAGDFFLLEAFFAGGSGTDIFRVGDVGEATGLTAGNGNAAGFALLAQSNPQGYADASFFAAGCATARYADMPAWRLAVKTSLESRYSGFTLRTGPTS